MKWKHGSTSRGVLGRPALLNGWRADVTAEGAEEVSLPVRAASTDLRSRGGRAAGSHSGNYNIVRRKELFSQLGSRIRRREEEAGGEGLRVVPVLLETGLEHHCTERPTS